MKKTTLLLCGFMLLSVFSLKLNAQEDKECSRLFYAYYDKFKKGNLEGSYAEWKQAFDLGCENYKYYSNILSDGEGILDYMLTNSTGQEKIGFAQDLIKIKEQRRKLDPELDIYWESAAVAAADTHGVISKEDAYKKYQDLFKRAKIKDSELTSEAVLGYYYTAGELYQNQKIDAKEFMSAFSDDVKVIKRNYEIRELKATDLQTKKDSLGISAAEQQDLDELKTFAEYFKGIEQTVSSNMTEFLNCDFLTQFYQADFESNKENLDWLNEAVYSLSENGLVEGGCDSEFATQLNDQFVKVYCEKNPEACKPQNTGGGDGGVAPPPTGGSGNSEEQMAYKAYKDKNYGKAISLLNKVVNNASGAKKGTWAYYLADSYLKTGNRKNAVVWYKKAAQYKPGWAAPYTGLARVFGDKKRINSCGKDAVQKLSGYLVAADYMKKAARYDGSLRKYVGQYEAAGPTESDMFKAGYSKGQKVRVTCNGGATTTLR